LPTISNSIFTVSFVLSFTKLVNLKVWGIIVTSKLLKFNLDTVNDTPLIAIDPFSYNEFFILFSNANLTIHDLSIILIFFITEVVSTWP